MSPIGSAVADSGAESLEQSGFELGPSRFGPAMRHAAVLVRDDVLHAFWSRVGDAPERIPLAELAPVWP